MFLRLHLTYPSLHGGFLIASNSSPGTMLQCFLTWEFLWRAATVLRGRWTLNFTNTTTLLSRMVVPIYTKAPGPGVLISLHALTWLRHISWHSICVVSSLNCCTVHSTSNYKTSCPAFGSLRPFQIALSAKRLDCESTKLNFYGIATGSRGSMWSQVGSDLWT